MLLFLPAIGPPAAVWLKSTVGTILQIFSPQLLQSPHTFGTISSHNVHSAAGGESRTPRSPSPSPQTLPTADGRIGGADRYRSHQGPHHPHQPHKPSLPLPHD